MHTVIHLSVISPCSFEHAGALPWTEVGGSRPIAAAGLLGVDNQQFSLCSKPTASQRELEMLAFLGGLVFGIKPNETIKELLKLLNNLFSLFSITSGSRKP